MKVKTNQALTIAATELDDATEQLKDLQTKLPFK